MLGVPLRLYQGTTQKYNSTGWYTATNNNGHLGVSDCVLFIGYK